LIMIYIEKGKRNVIALTLWETSKIYSPFFVLEFIPEGMKKDEAIVLGVKDFSHHKERVNIFIIDEGDSKIEVSLMRGQYTYNVYESVKPAESIGETTGEVIETGVLIVQVTEDEEDKGQNNQERNVYT